jgi:hypothetical protein
MIKEERLLMTSSGINGMISGLETWEWVRRSNQLVKVISIGLRLRKHTKSTREELVVEWAPKRTHSLQEASQTHQALLTLAHNTIRVDNRGRDNRVSEKSKRKMKNSGSIIRSSTRSTKSTINSNRGLKEEITGPRTATSTSSKIIGLDRNQSRNNIRSISLHQKASFIISTGDTIKEACYSRESGVLSLDTGSILFK